MSSVDDRIVNMQFNNKQFTQGAAESEKSLKNLDQTIANTAKGKGLGSLGDSVTQTSGKFSAMKIAGVTAVATIANKAVNAGLSLAKSLTIDPIMQGFNEYQTNLNSIQTVMANTGKGVNTVNKYMNQLNHYSDQTIYNFSEMARNIGTFTAAGVKLKPATQSIKGIANLAALSGSNSQQASTAMYQLSQAIAAGRVGLQDWNSVVNAGMGGAIFQKAIARTAETMGTLEKGAVKVNKETGKLTINGDNFRTAMTPKPGEAPWFTSDVLTKTLQQFTGDMSNAQLASEGFSKAQIKLIQDQARAAGDAAKRIKTLPQLIDVVKESVGSGFAQIFTNTMGNFNQSAKLWTSVGNKVTGVISKIFTATNNMLVGWRKLGGYHAMWEGFGNIFQALGNIIDPFVQAFKAILPATGTAGQGLANASFAFRDVTNAIEVGTRVFSKLTPILVGMIGGVKSLFGILGQGIGIVKKFFSALDFGPQAFGSTKASFESLKESLIVGLTNGFDVGSIKAQVKALWGQVVAAFKTATGATGSFKDIGRNIISGIGSGFDAGEIFNKIKLIATNIIDGFKSALGIHSPASTMIPIGLNIMRGIGEGIMTGIQWAGKAIEKGVAFIHKAFGTLFQGFDAMDFAGVINAILTAGVLIALKRGVDATSSIRELFGSLKEVFSTTKDSLVQWQKSLKAKMLLEIAGAIALTTISLIALAQIDPKKLAYGLGAIAIMLGTLTQSMKSLAKIGGDDDPSKKLAVMGASFLLISYAMINLAAAITIFAHQDPVKVAEGIGFMAATLGVLMGALLGFSKIKGSVEGMAGTILVISIALNVLVGAIAALGLLPWQVVLQGLGGIGIALALLVGTMLGLDKMKAKLEKAAGSILIISIALNVLVTAITAFGLMPMDVLVQGMIAMGAALLMLVTAIMVMSTNEKGVFAAATAIAIISGALNVLVPVILALGAAPWQVVARGLGFIAAALAIFLLAAAAAIPLAPGLAALSSALLAMGAAMLMAGVGMAAFGTGFALLAATGTAGVAVLIGAIHAFLGVLPAIAQQMAWALIAFLKVLANAMPKARTAFGKIFRNLIGVVTDNIPVLRKLLQTLIDNAIQVIQDSVPRWIEMGFTIIDKFLDSAEKHVPGIVDSAISLVTKFMKVIGDRFPALADQGAKMIIKLIHGVADAINKNVDDLRDAGVDLALAIINGMSGGLLGRGIELIKSAVAEVVSHIPKGVRKLLDINSPSKVMIPIGASVGEGLARGMKNSVGQVVAGVTRLANAIMAEGNSQILKVAESYRATQNKAYRMQAVADIRADAAQRAAARARAHKKNKALQKIAKNAKALADKSQKAADKQQTRADNAKQRIEDTRTFQEADSVGKGDIRSQQAVELADRANRMLQRANTEAAQARKLMRTNRKAGLALLAQSRRDARMAKGLADQAKTANDQADEFYRQGIQDRIKKLEQDAAYQKADDKGKAKILEKRAKAGEARAEALRKQSEALTDQAKAVANKDAAAALKLLTRAEEAAKAADDAASAAASDRQTMEDLLKPDTPSSDSATPSTSSGGSTITPSRSVLEQAAKSVDRYTKSLSMAEQLAAAASPTIQFVQTNNSPEALSASEIYRQTRNLVSLAELKMRSATN